jgi:hypothetical protein
LSEKYTYAILIEKFIILSLLTVKVKVEVRASKVKVLRRMSFKEEL